MPLVPTAPSYIVDGGTVSFQDALYVLHDLVRLIFNTTGHQLQTARFGGYLAGNKDQPARHDSH